MRARKKKPEEWKSVQGFPAYSVSSHGRVVNSRGWVLRMEPSSAEQPGGRVTLCDNGKQMRVRISVLVLEHFVCSRPIGLIACHRDDNVRNNYVGNLYWGTYSDNVRDAIRNGKHKGNSSKRSIESRLKMSRAHLKWSKEEVQTAKRMKREGIRLHIIAKVIGKAAKTVHQYFSNDLRQYESDD